MAKAIVLEVFRTAHAEKRRCLLYAYSGPGQVLEHELDLTPEGVGRLLAFNGTRFHGVQIGNRGRTGLHALCDPVHVFQDWAALGGWSW
ncbi:MAG TPA: hypothetical protein VKA84_19470 [Gemmatimonadaceae bacterium]|nr:hypothetical protein [Gemmatimonadaceae bacterium]